MFRIRMVLLLLLAAAGDGRSGAAGETGEKSKEKIVYAARFATGEPLTQELWSKYRRKFVTLHLTVKAVGVSPGRVYLWSTPKSTDKNTVAAVLQLDALPELKEKGIDDPKTHFFRKTIQVYGRLESTGGHPTIDVYHAKQIQILEPKLDKAKEPDAPQPDPAKGLRLSIQSLKGPVTLPQVNEETFRVKVDLENNSAETVIVWPYLSLEVRDSMNKRIPPSKIAPRWGLITARSILEEMKFVTVKPGAKYSFKASPSFHAHDPDRVLGWKFRDAGDYTLVFTYRYVRAAVKTKYGSGCVHLANPEKPWNKAIEFEQQIELKLTVEK